MRGALPSLPLRRMGETNPRKGPIPRDYFSDPLFTICLQAGGSVGVIVISDNSGGEGRKPPRL